MLARGTDVVGNQIIVRDLMPLLGVIPEVTHVLNQLPGMVHQRIVNQNHPAGRVARLRVPLQPRQPLLIEFGDIPVDFRDPAIETRLIGGLSKLRVNPRDGLLLRYQQPRQVLCKMTPFGGIGKEGSKLLHGVLYEGRKLNNGGHCSASLGDFPAQSPSAYSQCADLARSPRSLQKLSY